MGKDFKIQVPQSIVRNKDISDRSFVLLAKLIQAYYTQTSNAKELTFSINHKQIMYFTNLPNRKKFVECLRELYKHELITNEIKSLPKKNGLEITLSQKVIPELNEKQIFVQLENYVLHRSIIEEIGHTGVRILYYIKSFINYRQLGKDHCYASIQLMANDLGISEKTFIKYIKILEKVKFIKVKRNPAKPNIQYDKNGNEKLLFERLNNEYYIKHENFKKYIDKQTSLIHTEQDM
jgi:DNA-binding transcriptional regulator YhcF (GntR family)